MVKEVFESESFAVIGASREENKVGNVIFKNLISKGIKAFPVNPNTDEILGKKCYKSVLEIKEKVDSAIIAIRAEFVIDVMKDIIKKNIKNVIVISAGFSESGNKNLEEELKDICIKNNIKLLGPNTLGIINPNKNVNASFFDGMPKKGEIAFISQSGAIGTAVLDSGYGLSGFVSIGNSLCLDFSDFIEYFSNDKNTKVIAIYIESLRKAKGERFMKVCKVCKKPIVILKAGKSELGKKAASSHTAALASEEGIYEGIFKQCGIIEVDSIKMLFLVSEILSKYKNLGKKACIVTNAGGLGVLASDYCYKNNIELPNLPKDTLLKLDKILPNGWSRNNPIDILGDALPERYENTLKILEKEKFFDYFIILLTPQYMTHADNTADTLLSINSKPVIACFMGGEKVKNARKKLEGKITCFSELKEMGEVLGKVG